MNERLHWADPARSRLTGIFVVLLCPDIIESPMEVFRAYSDFTPCFPLHSDKFTTIPKLEEVSLPMLLLRSVR